MTDQADPLDATAPDAWRAHLGHRVALEYGADGALVEARCTDCDVGLPPPDSVVEPGEPTTRVGQVTSVARTAVPADPPRVLSLSEAADRLRMKRSNVAKFLARRDVRPAFAKAQGYLWWEADIERVRAERDADERQVQANERRRRTMTGAPPEVEPPRVPPELRRLGLSQRSMLGRLLRRPVVPDGERERAALRRLADRGLAERVAGARNEPRPYALTDRGREAARSL